MTLTTWPNARNLLAPRLILLFAVVAGASLDSAHAQSDSGYRTRTRQHDAATGPVQPATRKANTHKLRPVRSDTQSPKRKPTAAPVRHRSMLARAAAGELAAVPAARPVPSSHVDHQVAQTGFFGGCDGQCGLVCDCDSIGVAGEASCGIEPGCGIEHSIIPAEPTCGCGLAGCVGCGEAVCGVEEIYAEPVCGLESGEPCGCDACAIGHGKILTRLADIPLFLPLLKVHWNRFQFFAGTQGFKGPLNFAGIDPADDALRSGSGSFGFYQGFNESRSLKPLLGWDIAAQFGVRATQSNLSGAQFTEETRQQVFVTGGFFRRVDYGLQLGAVLDYLNDDWYFQGDLLQIRAEFGWKTQSAGVFGFQFTSSLGPDSSTTTLRDSTGTLFNGSIEFEPTDQYRFFYRSLLNGGGDWTAFGGFTEEDDGLVGLNLNLPIRKKLVLNTGATFLVPREGDQSGGSQEEGWNISLGLTFRPGGPRGAGRYTRPLFDVADNGTFLVDFR